MIYDKFTKIIEEKYGNIYKTIPWSGEVSCHSKIKMVCPIHGEVEQVISFSWELLARRSQSLFERFYK